MLEHWKEKDLEDYIWNTPSVMNGWLQASRFGCNTTPTPIRLGRQLKCETGRIDLLMHYEHCLYVIELKAVKADTAALGQVVRYAECIENLLTSSSIHKDPLDTFAIYRLFHKDVAEIHRVLIAPSFDPLMIPAANDNTHLVKVSQQNNEFVFSELRPAACDADLNSDLAKALAPFVEYGIEQSKIYTDWNRKRGNEEAIEAFNGMLRDSICWSN